MAVRSIPVWGSAGLQDDEVVEIEDPLLDVDRVTGTIQEREAVQSILRCHTAHQSACAPPPPPPASVNECACFATPRLMMSDPIGSMLTILEDSNIGPVFTRDEKKRRGGGLKFFSGPISEGYKTRVRVRHASRLHAAWPEELTIKRDISVRDRPCPVTPPRNVSRSFACAGESLPDSAVQHDRAVDQRVRSCALETTAVAAVHSSKLSSLSLRL